MPANENSAPCCDINASYPGKHRGGCSGEKEPAQAPICDCDNDYCVGPDVAQAYGEICRHEAAVAAGETKESQS